MKESVTKFDLEAAFKALDEIEIPRARKGIAANKVNLKETFTRKSKLDLLMEDYYDVNDTADLEAAKEEREAEIAKAKLARIEKIVDLNAESSEDLLTSYVGKVIVQCPQCMTLFYKNQEDIEKSEEDETVVNVNETCQHCGNTSGYTLIGKVDKVGKDEASEYDVEDFDENELNLNFDEPENEEDDTEETEEVAEEDTENADLEPVVDENEEEQETTEVEEVKESLTLNEDVDDETEIEDEGFLDEVEDETTEIAEEPVEEEPTEEVEEILTSVEEVKEVAVEAAEAVVEASEEEPVEDIKEITDEVVEDHFEISEEENEGIAEEEIEETEEVEEIQEVEEAEEEVEEEEVIEESLTEAVDKELDDKLKAHNEYIDYLKEMIEKEEKSLANAKNDFVKKSIQSRIDALKADLEAALPEALKGEVETELPTAEEVDLNAAENVEEEKVEEVKESLQEDCNTISTTNETLVEDADTDVTDAEVEELMKSEEFKTPISEEEVEAYLEESHKVESILEGIDEIDEESIENCINESLVEVYSNVDTFKLVSCELTENALKINGKVNFKSGNINETSYTFTEAKFLDENKLALKGINEMLGKESNFVLETTVNNEAKTLIAESFSYSYKINDILVEGLIKK